MTALGICLIVFGAAILIFGGGIRFGIWLAEEGIAASRRRA